MNPVRFRTRTGPTLLALGAAAALTLGGAVAPASAASDQILVSADGVHYSTTLGASLFDGIGLLIPGGSQAATLWVKNPTPSAVEVRLSASDYTASAPAFAANVTLISSNSIDAHTTSQPLSTLENCDVLIDSKGLAAGETIAMTVTFTMADVTGLVGQDERANLNLHVGMRDTAAGAFPASACDDSGVVIGLDPDPEPSPTSSPSPSPTTSPSPTSPATAKPGSSSSASSSGPLAHTGFDAAAPLMVVGGLIVGGVFFFMVGRRRRMTDR